MAIKKSKVAVGFIVVGILTVFFGTILTFVGPIIIDDQIVKVGSRTFIMLNIYFIHCWHLFAAPVRVRQSGT